MTVDVTQQLSAAAKPSYGSPTYLPPPPTASLPHRLPIGSRWLFYDLASTANFSKPIYWPDCTQGCGLRLVDRRFAVLVVNCSRLFPSTAVDAARSFSGLTSPGGTVESRRWCAFGDIPPLNLGRLYRQRLPLNRAFVALRGHIDEANSFTASDQLNDFVVCVWHVRLSVSDSFTTFGAI